MFRVYMFNLTSESITCSVVCIYILDHTVIAYANVCVLRSLFTSFGAVKILHFARGILYTYIR